MPDQKYSNKDFEIALNPHARFRAVVKLAPLPTSLQRGRRDSKSRSAPRAVPPGIERYFQTSLFLLIVTGFATLASTGKLDLLSVLFVSCALLYRAKQLACRSRTVQIPERVTSYLGLIYVLVYVADFFPAFSELRHRHGSPAVVRHGDQNLFRAA